MVTGLGWMGSGIGSVDTALEELISSARNELLVLAYSITDGASDLLQLIRSRLADGVRVTIVVDNLADQFHHTMAQLRRMKDDYPSHCHVYGFSGSDDAHLHAKVIIADRERAMVGSANLSWHGLVTNHELCVMIDGQAVRELAQATDKLLSHRYVTPAW